jgi:type 1 glutamine amidotransferase
LFLTPRSSKTVATDVKNILDGATFTLGQGSELAVKFSTKPLAEAALKFNYPSEIYYVWVGTVCHIVSAETLEIIELEW